MHDLTLLRDLLILVAFAIPAAAVAQRIRVPLIVSFLCVGMLIGPSGLGLIGQADDVAALAELGVVLLLFEIGLEVSLAQIIRMRTLVVVGGVLQIGGTVGGTVALAMAFGIPFRQAVAFGLLIALSSTAVVLKLVRDRGELDTPYGKVAIGILLFQDLAVVPMMVVLPLLAVDASADIGVGLLRVGVSVLVVTGIAFGGRLIVPWVLERVADSRDRELFTLTIALFGLGAAFLTASVGLSLALGAFLAGLVISESEYGAQAVSDVLPFRALFSGIFFISVGMLLDIGLVLEDAWIVLGLTLGVIVGKAVVVGLTVVFGLGRSLATGVIAGLSLAQAGEFSFVLAGMAERSGLLSAGAFQQFLAAAILSMLVAPALIAWARPVADHVSRLAGRTGGSGAGERQSGKPMSDHAIVVGYGMSGQLLTRILRAVHLPFVVLETNGRTVREARRKREPIFFGDGTRREILLQAGIERAKAVIFNISSPLDERRGVAMARSLNPAAFIIVRTRAIATISDLESGGADEVVVEEYEAALELFQRVLRQYRIPVNTIAAELDAIRSEQYGILRGVPKSTLRLDDLSFLGVHHALELVMVEAGSRGIGESPVSLQLRQQTGATVIAVVRDGEARYTPDPAFEFAEGDVVVLVGPSPALQRGADVFRAARSEMR